MTFQFPTAVKERFQASPSQIADFCQRWNIVELALFSSILRDDFRPDSDIDILASFAPNTCWNLFDWMQMQEQLEIMLDRTVDLTQKQQLNNPFSRNEILRTYHIIYSKEPTILNFDFLIKPADISMQADNKNRAALWDLIQAIRQIIEFTANLSGEEFLGNLLVQRAVEREFEILGLTSADIKACLAFAADREKKLFVASLLNYCSTKTSQTESLRKLSVFIARLRI